MLYQIFVHTPHWVWGVLALLLWLGLSQVAPRRVGLPRVIVMPVMMTGFSLYGTLSTFGAMNMAWVLWLGAAVATAAWFSSGELPFGAQYDAASRRFSLPGSWTPLALMMAIFLTKYVVGVTLAMHPQLASDPATAAIVASVYGALSGVFTGRMVRLLRLTRLTQPKPEAANVSWG